MVDSIRMVYELYGNRTGYDQVVFWPDYKVYGSIRNIIDIFRNSGINRFQVGSLYAMTNGQIGCPPQILPLTEEVVTACSFNPLNPVHEQFLQSLIDLDLQQPQRQI